MVGVLRTAAVSAFGLLTPALVLAQETAGEGRMLERRGRYEEAAQTYRAVLLHEPGSTAAWLGLERVLTNLGRLRSIVPLLDSTLMRDPEYGSLYELRLRVWSQLGEPDSVAATANRWIERFPDTPHPYRQWAYSLTNAGNVSGGLMVLEEAKRALGSGALAPEMATLLGSLGRWEASAREWGLAVAQDRTNLAAAGMNLSSVPESARGYVTAVLGGSDSAPVLRQLCAELLVAWERPDEGWELLQDVLPPDRGEAAAELRLFADRLIRQETTAAARIRAYALERLAEIADGPESERARLDAAQAYADASDFAGARRMLGGLLNANEALPVDAGAAVSALIRVAAESGQIEEAEERLRSWEQRLNPSDVRDLRARIAWAWVMSGEFDRARLTLRGDSSTAASAILGWAFLFDGRLRTATAHFLAAGPYARDRDQATRRTAVLALLQGVEPDSVAALGAALFSLERADTSGALGALEQVARDLPAEGGRSPVLAFAGRVARQSGDLIRAEALLSAALDADSLGPYAPAAEFSLAAVLADSGRSAAAAERLEHMILTHPGSALVPEARRLLDQVRGAIPRQ